MDKIHEYQERAYCLRIAARNVQPHLREQYEDLARVWERMAKQRMAESLRLAKRTAA